MKYGNQLRYAIEIVKEYDGSIPLAAWLKQFYKQNKQMGGRDRKTVSEMVFTYYRLGHNQFTSVNERMLAAVAASPNLQELKQYFFPADTDSKTSQLFSVDNIFPWRDLLSDGIDADAFSQSFLVQPDVFLRVRPGKHAMVDEKLRKAGVPFRKCGADCIAVMPAAKIDEVLDVNSDVVIQDKSSQDTALLLDPVRNLFQNRAISVWDSCAASGGKSIMVHDLIQSVELTVSDIRESIVRNLHTRFRQAGIHKFQSFVADVTNPRSEIPGTYDLIIADVPCSGSGTWSRTPEQLFFTTPNKIDYYSNLQKSIVTRLIPHLRRHGFLLYITCSVFRKENEEVVEYLKTSDLNVVEQKVFAGYHDKADTLFGALLRGS